MLVVNSLIAERCAAAGVPRGYVTAAYHCHHKKVCDGALSFVISFRVVLVVCTDMQLGRALRRILAFYGRFVINRFFVW